MITLQVGLLALLTIFQACTAAPAHDGPPQCSSPTIRREWRALSTTERQAYIDGVKCLQTLPSRTAAIKEAKTRFDDFQSVHIVLAPDVHVVGQFLAWHRFYLHLYEKALREECGYKGSQPYWDWTLDVKDGLTSFAASPIFDPTYGFGGNGANIPGFNGLFNNMSSAPDWDPGSVGPGGGCIQDGPFASYNLSLGPGPTMNINRCITRWFIPGYFQTINEKNVSSLDELDTFEEFRIELEGTPSTEHVKSHDGGHLAVGGEMSDRYASPGDPIFYLHHANVDRLWWKWQSAKLQQRLYAISGPSTVDPPYRNVTLDFVLPAKGLTPGVSIRDIMDVRNEILCYNYA
ncbi:tyrosinase central domain-containing protein [Moniliophthora roreri MCA 2997]|uniref:Tyrosinase central domain-containing protein n=2 Tax=Moniliophthora roreri TaxID=221103 RepID=V2YHW2_MONRO|nr:tyrosinase central domain-containing protein [Moniliophthora roreri MCA 2997]KAI3601648.1 tyrosinase central domain-containing protein [Moniliophthora roreri]